MKNSLIICIVLLLSVLACKTPPKHVPPSEIAMVIGDPVEYGSKDYILFPVGGNYNPEISQPKADYSNNEPDEETSNDGVLGLTSNASKGVTLQKRSNDLNSSYMMDKDAQYEFGNANESDFDIRNLLFYNKKTGASYPLVDDTIHILSFAFHYEFKKPLVFYRIVKKDINKDNKYNSKDAVMLYISDTLGRNFTIITPENEQLLTYFHYPESNTLLVKTALDIDKNGKFTESDETNFREVKLDNPALGRPIFSDSLKANLKKLMY